MKYATEVELVYRQFLGYKVALLVSVVRVGSAAVIEVSGRRLAGRLCSYFAFKGGAAR